MRILFIHAATVAGGTSEVASARLRALIPAAELGRSGHVATVETVNDDAAADAVIARLRNYDALVVSKSFLPAVEAVVAAASAAGLRTVFDVCDDHFGEAQLGPHYRRLAALSGAVSANTPVMAGIVQEHTGRSAVVIADPIEGARGEPRALRPAEGDRPLALLWFGHPSNLGSLEPLLATLPRFGTVTTLTVVTTPGAALLDLAEGFNKAFRRRCRIVVVPWSQPALSACLDACDMVLIPSPPGDRPGRSANRLIESLWAGRFVAAHPAPAYRELAEHAWIGSDLLAGVAWAMAEPAGVLERIEAAQRWLPQRYAPAVVGAAWAALLAGS